MRSRSLLALCVLACVTGCRWLPCMTGSYTEGMPRLSHPLAKDATVWVPQGAEKGSLYARRERTLSEAFRKAFGDCGASLATNRATAAVAVKLDVRNWEYNDAGFSGWNRERNDVTVGVALSEPKTQRILQRATVHIDDDFRIVEKYVKSLYEER